jgi:uncharacterized protein (TIGR02246 family)
MRTCVSILSAAAVLFVSGCKPSVDLEKERSALLATDSEWMHSANDASKFASYYTADASFDVPGAPAVKGQAAIRDTFKQLNSAPGFALEWHVVQSKVAAGGDIAYTTGTYQLTVTGGGEKGKYVTVWAKQADGNWRVTDDIFNSDEPPPPPPPPPPPLLPPHAATPKAASGVMQTMASALRSVFISLPLAGLWVDSPKAVRLFVRLSCHLEGKFPDGNSTVFAHFLCSVCPVFAGGTNDE